MKRIKMTADALLGIIEGVFAAVDLPTTIDDKQSTILDMLNVEWYSFKHRVKPAEDYLDSMNKSLTQAYGLCELLTAKRLYSNDIDHLQISGRLMVWLQTPKIKLLEALIEECNERYCGEISEVQIDGELRSMLVEFEPPQLIRTQTASEIGESAILAIAITMELAPSIYSYTDYKIEFSFGDDTDDDYLIAPYTAWTYMYNASQVPIPTVNNADSGFVNVSQSNSLSLCLYEINNTLTEKLREIALSCNAIGHDGADLNKTIFMRITVGEKAPYVYKVVPKAITMQSTNAAFNTMAVVFAPKGGA